MRVPLSAAKPIIGLTPEEKTAALQQVLSSRTFQKSDLLIKFLRFVCEKEFAGQNDLITEYSIATEALGRPADFSPEADSSVRSRAHALRRKLEDCYREELAAATVRIVLPKGSYVPEFLVPPEESAPPSTLPDFNPTVRPKPVTSLLIPISLAFAAGILATLIVISVLGNRGGSGSPIPAPLRRAWGPILFSDSEVMVVVGVPKQFWARDFTGLGTPRNSSWYPNLPQDPQLQQWFFDSSLVNQKSFILLHPNVGSPLWGDVAGALGAVKTLGEHGIRHQVLPERVLKPYALRGRNVLLFGNPEYSPAVRQLLKDAPFRVEYDPQSRWEAVLNRQPRSGEPDAFRRSRSDDCLGVISVIAGDREDQRSSQIVVFSGLTSAGTQAAEEFFASPVDLEELEKRFRAEGIKGWPRSYQVLVEANTDGNLPIRHRYKTHRILTP